MLRNVTVVWALNTTYIPTRQGFAYLTAIVDVASRRVMTHKVVTTLDACHAKEILQQALTRHRRPEIVNTNQGSQFADEEFTAAVLGSESESYSVAARSNG